MHTLYIKRQPYKLDRNKAHIQEEVVVAPWESTIEKNMGQKREIVQNRSRTLFATSAAGEGQLGVAALGERRQVALGQPQAAAVGRELMEKPPPEAAAAPAPQRVPPAATKARKVHLPVFKPSAAH